MRWHNTPTTTIHCLPHMTKYGVLKVYKYVAGFNHANTQLSSGRPPRRTRGFNWQRLLPLIQKKRRYAPTHTAHAPTTQAHT